MGVKKEEIEKILVAEVEEYDQYLRGEIYSASLVRSCKCKECGDEHEEIIDSCGGFYSIEDIWDCLGIKKEDYEEVKK